MVPRLTQEPKRTPSTDDSISECFLDPLDVYSAFLRDFSIFWIDDAISTLAAYRFEVSVFVMWAIKVIMLSRATQVATSICKVRSGDSSRGSLSERKPSGFLLHRLSPLFDNISLCRRNRRLSTLFISNVTRLVW